MKKIIEKILANLAKKILKKYNPEIIGITGSVGKTSTKEAVFSVLKNDFNVRQSSKNYNTEIGVPLTIIDAESGGKNIFKWIGIIFKAWKLILFKNKSYPKILVLEMAADHPGDIEYLVKLAPLKIGVVTAIGPTHLEFFETIENLIQEKEKLVTSLKKQDWAILNADDNLVLPISKNVKSKVITFGLNSQAQIKATELNYEKDGSGLMCKISDENSIAPAHFKNVLASSQISSILASISIAKIYKIDLEQAIKNSLSADYF